MYEDVDALIARIQQESKERRRREAVGRLGRLFVYAASAGMLFGAVRSAFADDEAVYVPSAELSPEVESFRYTMDDFVDAHVGRDVDVTCAYLPPVVDENDQIVGWISGLHIGVQGSDESDIILDKTLCDTMQSLSTKAGQHEITTEDGIAAQGLLVLGHEIAHAEGETNEGLANCRAVELYPMIADALGIESIVGDIDALALSRSIPQPPVYHSAGC